MPGKLSGNFLPGRPGIGGYSKKPDRRAQGYKTGKKIASVFAVWASYPGSHLRVEVEEVEVKEVKWVEFGVNVRFF